MEKILRRIVFIMSAIVICGLAIHTPLTVLVTTHVPELSLVVKAWKELLLGLILVALVIAVTYQHRWREVVRDRIVQLAAAAGIMMLIAAVISMRHTSSTALAAGVLIDGRVMMALLDFYIAARFLWPEIRQLIVRCAAATTSIIAAFAVVQLVLPRDFLKLFGYSHQTIEPYMTVDKAPGLTRQNSTMRGPNPLGAYGGASLIFVLEWWRYHRARLGSKKVKAVVITLLFALIVCLVVSYSRSAWLAAAVGVGLFVLLSFRRYLTPKVWIVGLVIIGALLGSIFALRNDALVSTVFFHDNPTGSVTKSDDQHAASIVHAVQSIVAWPFGHGAGSAGSASLLGPHPIIIENQYLFWLYEFGIVGGLIVIALFLYVIYRAFRSRDWLALSVAISGIVLGLIGVLLPVFTDDVIAIMWWSVAGVALASSGTIKAHAKRPTSHQKTKANA